MSYSFYDWNNSLQQRNEYVEDRLKDGSPIIAVSFDGGILMLTLRSAQRKVFEVYDRLIMGALGKQSDIESLRLAAIDTAHREGFERSPDDVSIQRLVGFSLSPAIKRVYNDQSAIPLTVRAVFAEMGRTPAQDHLFVLGYDGEFKAVTGSAVAAGTPYAEEQAESVLRDAKPASLDEALRAALTAWGTGRSRLAPKAADDEDEFDPLSDRPKEVPTVTDDPAVALREALKNGLAVEAAVLDRRTGRESKFRILRENELESALADYR
jgi:proteasome alpha subunit